MIITLRGVRINYHWEDINTDTQGRAWWHFCILQHHMKILHNINALLGWQLMIINQSFIHSTIQSVSQTPRKSKNQSINWSKNKSVKQSQITSVSQSAWQLLIVSHDVKPFVDKNSLKAPFPHPKIMTHESHF